MADKVTFKFAHIYNLNNRGLKVNTEKGCADYCNKNAECLSFQYF